VATRENFKKDLSWGEKWEKIISLHLSLNGCSNLDLNPEKNYKYDLIGKERGVPTKWEVKSDKYPKTGNMAVEIRDAGKPSGISKTEADVFVYNFTNISDKFVYLFFINVKDLKALIRDNFDKLRVVNGGDNNEAEIVLIPMKRFQSHFRVETMKKKLWDLPE
tara:strand:- start:5433 stop:5921 length:489 start_codon:yes stop_codon:yes gene_type:complete